MKKNMITPAQIHSVENDVEGCFLLYPINLKTGKVDYTKLQSGIKVTFSGSIHEAVCCYAAGYGFEWDRISEYPVATIQKVLSRKLDALMSLLVYSHRLDIDLDVSDTYLLIEKHKRIILTTESLMEDNLGFIAKSVDDQHQFPHNRPDLIRTAHLYNEHVEFNILVHHLVECDYHGFLVSKHTLATFEPLDYHEPLTTQSFEFLCNHEKRNQAKSSFDTRLHYDFFHQNWQPVKDISSNGVLPNGNILRYEHADFF